MSAQITSLQDQVDTLYANLSSLRSELAANNPPIDPSLQQQNTSYTTPNHHRTNSQCAPKPPMFRGITSNEYNFDIAKSSLQTMGIAPVGQGFEEALTREVSPNADGYPIAPTVEQAKDPIWSVSKDEALRLLKVYEDEVHVIHPVLAMQKLTAHVHSVYRFMDAAVRGGLVLKDMPGADRLDDENTNLLKMCLAIAMTMEGAGQSELGQSMFEFVQPQVDSLLLGNSGVQDVRLLVLTVSAAARVIAF